MLFCLFLLQSGETIKYSKIIFNLIFNITILCNVYLTNSFIFITVIIFNSGTVNYVMSIVDKARYHSNVQNHWFAKNLSDVISAGYPCSIKSKIMYASV